MSAFLEDVAKKILELPEPTKSLYARALRDSFEGYLGTVVQKNPHVAKPQISPLQVEERHGININDQDEFCISLKKAKAHLFLKEQGRKVNIREELKASAYKDKLERETTKVGNALIFTYAEILYLAKHMRPITLPESLSAYLATLT